MNGPLDGIKILDFTAMMSGPLATMLLADQGAEVIKIEPPSGELTRNVGVQKNGMSSSFLSCNKSKKSLCLDLKTNEGRDIIKNILPSCDVLVQNFRPGTIERMGLSYENVKSINPKIIFVSISGFGKMGPYHSQRVYDPVIQAMSGLAEIQKDLDSNRPKMVRTVIADKTTALTAAQAISSALFFRERHGVSQSIDISMLDSMIAYLWPEGSASLSFKDKIIDPTEGSLGLDLVYKTKDKKFITAGAVSDKEWIGMCNSINRRDLIEDPRFKLTNDRFKNSNERRKIITDEIIKFDSEYILSKFIEEQVPCAPILSRKELLEHEQVKISDIIQTDNSKYYGQFIGPRQAAIFSESPNRIKRSAPLLGAHTRELMQEIGYSENKISDLINKKVIFSNS